MWDYEDDDFEDMSKGHYLCRWTLSCVQCQHSKVHRHTVTPMGFFSPSDARFDHVDIDIVGPLPPATGNMHSQTCVDCFTCWLEVILLSDASTENVAQAFLLGWIAQFGVPTTLTSDQGGQFESNVWNHLMQLLGIHCIHTTAYHPCSNGLVERLHCQFKASLMVHVLQTNWVKSLPLALLGIRTALKEDIQHTSAELVYGTTLCLSGAFFADSSSSEATDTASYVSRLKDMKVPLHHRCCPDHQPWCLQARPRCHKCEPLVLADVYIGLND